MTVTRNQLVTVVDQAHVANDKWLRDVIEDEISEAFGPRIKPQPWLVKWVILRIKRRGWRHPWR